MGLVDSLFLTAGTAPSDAGAFDPQPSAIPAGFDSIIQISTPLMHRTLDANLSQWNLNVLSARVPYRAELVSPRLRAMIQQLVPPLETVAFGGQTHLEVQLLNPAPQHVVWPAQLDPPVATRSSAESRTALPQRHKTVSVVWTIKINLFRPRLIDPVVLGSDVANQPRGPADSSPPRRGGSTTGMLQGTGTLPLANGQIAIVPTALPEGSRTLLAQGTATMNVPSELSVDAQLYQFRLVVNFEGTQPTYTSDDPTMLEFLRTDLASSMLRQAIAPLLNHYAVGLSPTIALAGSLTPGQLAEAQLPALKVMDMLLQDARGQLVVFCISLGNDTYGAFSMVRSFLSGEDFAYYVSDKVYSPVLKGLWRANAMYMPIVSDVPVQMPVAQDSDQTATGRARVQVTLDSTLSDAALTASTDMTVGDPMLITSQETVNLLALWDPQGNQVTELGDLATPTREPFALAVNLFVKTTATQQILQSPLIPVLTAMFRPLYFPMIEEYGATAVNGFTSSPLRAVVVRWSLPRAMSGGVTSGGGDLLAR